MLHTGKLIAEKYANKKDKGFPFTRNLFISALIIGYLDFFFIKILPVELFKEYIPAISGTSGRTLHGTTIEVLFTYFWIILPYMLYKYFKIYDCEFFKPVNTIKILLGPFLIALMFYLAYALDLEPVARSELIDSKGKGYMGVIAQQTQIGPILWSFFTFYLFSILIVTYYYHLVNLITLIFKK